MESYTAQDIQVLTGLEPVRKRPGLYIGSVDSAGLHHLIWEILDNSIDEVMNGYATWVELELDRDGRSIRVTDNGRGIPVDIHQEYGKSALELIMTTLHAGGKFAHANYTYSGGLHGVGASVVNALSERLEVTVKRDGGEWFQSYNFGVPTAPVAQVGDNVRGSGTSIWFRPDEEIFEETIFDPKIILDTLESRAWLHKVKIIFKDRVNGVTHKLDHCDSGLDGYLAQLVGEEPRASAWEENIFSYQREEDIRMEAAVLWSQAGGEQIGRVRPHVAVDRDGAAVHPAVVVDEVGVVEDGALARAEHDALLDRRRHLQSVRVAARSAGPPTIPASRGCCCARARRSGRSPRGPGSR